MRFRRKNKRDWNPWYAWYPVKISKEWVWFEWVERSVVKFEGFFGDNDTVRFYRFKGDE